MELFVRQTTHYNLAITQTLVGRLRSLSNRHINRVGVAREREA